MRWNKDTIGLSVESPELLGSTMIAMAVWNSVDCGRLKLALDLASENKIALLPKKDWPFEAKALGVTTLTHSGPQKILSKVRIDLNQDAGVWSATDYQNVLLHELGHVLGLEHVEQFDAVMHPYTQLGYFELKLSQTDKKNFCELIPVEQGPQTGCSQTGYSTDMGLFGVVILALLICCTARKHSSIWL